MVEYHFQQNLLTNYCPKMTLNFINIIDSISDFKCKTALKAHLIALNQEIGIHTTNYNGQKPENYIY